MNRWNFITLGILATVSVSHGFSNKRFTSDSKNSIGQRGIPENHNSISRTKRGIFGDWLSPEDSRVDQSHHRNHHRPPFTNIDNNNHNFGNFPDQTTGGSPGQFHNNNWNPKWDSAPEWDKGPKWDKKPSVQSNFDQDDDFYVFDGGNRKETNNRGNNNNWQNTNNWVNNNWPNSNNWYDNNGNNNNRGPNDWDRQNTNQPTTQSTLAIPGMGTTRSPCEDACQTTPEYNPVCADLDTIATK